MQMKARRKEFIVAFLYSLFVVRLFTFTFVPITQFMYALIHAFNHECFVDTVRFEHT